MKNKSFCLLLLTVIFSVSSFAQIKYEKGYIIDNTNLRTECLIKNNDWENTPTEIQYKINEESKEATVGIDNIREFGIGNTLRYIRYDIDIDQSPEDLNSLNKERNPIFKKERVFLKQLVEGSANLYIYSGVNKRKYFYSTTEIPAKQLIYKQFFKQVDYNSHLETNNFYRSQLFIDVNCNNVLPKSFDKINYTENSLVKYFLSYNQCKGDKTDKYAELALKKKGVFQIKIVTGINQSSLKIDNLDYEKNVLDFNAKTNPIFGTEFEYILPFNKNKWSIFVEPTYTSYKSSAIYTYHNLSGAHSEEIEVKGRFIDLPIGIRHYIFLNDNSKIFLNIGYLNTFSHFSDIKSVESDNINLTEFKSIVYGTIAGIGFSHKKLSMEARYYTSKDVDNYVFRNSSYKSVALILSYKIL